MNNKFPVNAMDQDSIKKKRCYRLDQFSIDWSKMDPVIICTFQSFDIVCETIFNVFYFMFTLVESNEKNLMTVKGI